MSITRSPTGKDSNTWQCTHPVKGALSLRVQLRLHGQRKTPTLTQEVRTQELSEEQEITIAPYYGLMVHITDVIADTRAQKMVSHNSSTHYRICICTRPTLRRAKHFVYHHHEKHKNEKRIRKEKNTKCWNTKNRIWPEKNAKCWNSHNEL